MRRIKPLIYSFILVVILTGCGALQLLSESSGKSERQPETAEKLPSPQAAEAKEVPVSESKTVKDSQAKKTPQNTPHLPQKILGGDIVVRDVPIKTPSDAPANSGGNVGESSEKLLQEYMDSGRWLKDLFSPDIEDEWDLFADGDYENCGLEITAYKIFDFDGDGVSELWLEAYEDSVAWSWGMSGFYTVESSQVKNLIIGRQTGGSIGGDYIVMGYDNSAGCHIVVKTGFVGGFGGQITYSAYYDYKAGQLTEIANTENAFFIDEKIPREFMVNGKIVPEDDYWALEERFSEPIAPFYYLHEE